MKFILLISRNVFFDATDSIRSEIFALLNLIKDKEISLVLVTRSKEKYKKIIEDNISDTSQIFYRNRSDLSKKVIKNNRNVMLVGAVNEDIRIAANNKILLINPLWIKGIETKIEQYGFQLKSFNQIIQCIEILSLDNHIFYDLKVDEKTRLIAVSNANKFYAVEKEADMIQKYRNTLKFNNDYYKYAVYFHYLTMVLGMEEFRDVDYWMSVPSSSGSTENYIYDIVKRTRYLLNNRKSKELFVRHTPAPKSTYMSKAERLRLGSTRHFDTIHLDPSYEGKLKGKKVCVLDDYVTNGSSFECIRNLLIHEGVEEIILVAIGTFQNPYVKEDYRIQGDVFDTEYQYTKSSSKSLRGKINEKSSDIINSIHDIVKRNTI